MPLDSAGETQTNKNLALRQQLRSFAAKGQVFSACELLSNNTDLKLRDIFIITLGFMNVDQ